MPAYTPGDEGLMIGADQFALAVAPIFGQKTVAEEVSEVAPRKADLEGLPVDGRDRASACRCREEEIVEALVAVDWGEALAATEQPGSAPCGEGSQHPRVAPRYSTAVVLDELLGGARQPGLHDCGLRL